RKAAEAAHSGILRENAAKAMMTFVNMDSPGLVILPTHRVIFGLESFDAATFLDRVRELYEVRELGAVSAAAAVKTLREAGKKATSFVAAARSGNVLLTAKQGSSEQIGHEFSQRQRKLDVVHLHALVLEKTLGISRQQITDQQHVRYLRDAEEVLKVVNSDSSVNVAFLMNPVSIEQVREIAFVGEVLPQKSTDFYPKMLSGLTIFPLDYGQQAQTMSSGSRQP
ncbi:MAG TPA: DUF1015 family protein, partial [Terriglobales bacterium]|nr:DUF1015 family protein [Terriglobales bacterium]